MAIRIGLGLIVVAAIAGLTAACTSTPSAPCPGVSILGDASEITLFAQGQGQGQDLTDVAYRASIERLASNCDYTTAGDTVTSTVAARLVATRGPAAQASEKTFVYFVAVVDKDQKVLARERFDSTFTFQANQRQAAAIEEIEQILPIRADLRGLDYEILVGFDLTPEQLEFNRQERQRRTGLPRLPGR
jgi:hypothetical protein